jgi:hypothetical protein
MGINCSKLESKGTSQNAICNFNNLNKNSVPYQNQATCTLDAKQNFSEESKELDFVNSETINLKIFHQNIRGLRNKIYELITHLSDCVRQVLSFTEHHLKDFEINNTCINCYNLGAFYCRKNRKFGGVGIFVHDTLSCTPIDLTEYCSEQDLEASSSSL